MGLPACIPQSVLRAVMSLGGERLERLGWESSQAGVPSAPGEGLCLLGVPAGAFGARVSLSDVV